MAIVCLDVQYFGDEAITGFVIFNSISDSKAMDTGQVLTKGIKAYEPGAFFKRELPCLLNAIDFIATKITLIIVDAYVWLSDDKMGLGGYLYQALGEKIPVIGVSKSKFMDNTFNVIPVLRGLSLQPLYVSSIGIDTITAAEMIKKMEGPYRLPTMIKLADAVCRGHVN